MRVLVSVAELVVPSAVAIFAASLGSGTQVAMLLLSMVQLPPRGLK
ncbi:hypothetical protein KIMH_13970 [Bombiscardovia apis]|uniref:Uncharacterized protein n=1 Tax=Bombiscardovia apis TaxID=2932182 RepID=A0ABN6SH17_9BIFI|nr:hypothetical protein KIMH_13970 [Bombiscardovia apis]